MSDISIPLLKKCVLYYKHILYYTMQIYMRNVRVTLLNTLL